MWSPSDVLAVCSTSHRIRSISADDSDLRVQFLIHIGKKLVNLHDNGWVHRDLKVRT